MSVKKVKYGITIAALLIAIAHVLWPSVTVDAITVTLLVVALLPWLSLIFKSIELPGGVKIEYRDLEKIEESVRKAGLFREQPAPEVYSFQTIASTDPHLALAGLRIELEKRLVRLAESQDVKVTRRGIGGLLADLNTQQVINSAERSVLSELISLLNSAVHGATVELSATQWALDVGLGILSALDERASSPHIRYEGIDGKPSS